MSQIVSYFSGGIPSAVAIKLAIASENSKEDLS